MKYLNTYQGLNMLSLQRRQFVWIRLFCLTAPLFISFMSTGQAETINELTLDGVTRTLNAGDILNGPLTLRNGALLDIGSTSQKFSVTQTGASTGRGTIVGNGTGTLEITGAASDCWYNFNLPNQGALTISAANYAFQGNSSWGTLTFSGGGSLWLYGNSVYNGTITTSSNADGTFKAGTLYPGKMSGTGSTTNAAVFNGAIEGGFSINAEQYSNTVFIATFNAANSYSGGTTIGSYTTINLEKAGTLGAGATTIKSGGKLNIQNTTADLTLTSAVTISNGASMTVSNTGAGVTLNSITIAPGGAFNVDGTLSSAISGTYNINGTLNAKTNNAFSTAAILKFGAGGTLDAGSTTQSLKLQGTGKAHQGTVKGNGATVTLVNTSGDVWTSIDLGTTGKLFVANSCGDLAWQGTFSFDTMEWQRNGGTLWLYANSTVTGKITTAASNTNQSTLRLGCTSNTNGAPLTLDGAISGKFNILLSNESESNPAGTVVFTSANSYTGSTTITNGTLKLTDDGTFGTGAVINNSAIIFENTNGQTISNAITGTGSVTVQGETETAIALSGANTYEGGTTLESGTIRLTGAGSLGTGALKSQSGSSIVLDNGWTASLANSSFDLGGTLTDLSENRASFLAGKEITVDLVNSQDGKGIISMSGEADIANLTLKLTNSGAAPIELGDQFLIVSATNFDTFDINDLNFDESNNVLFAYDLGLWRYDFTTLPGGYALTAIASDRNQVPEPATWALLALGTIGIAVLRRKRR